MSIDKIKKLRKLADNSKLSQPVREKARKEAERLENISGTPLIKTGKKSKPKLLQGQNFPLGWGDSIIVTPEKTKVAKEWWSSLSINEQKDLVKKHLPENYPSNLVYTKDGKILIFLREKEFTDKPKGLKSLLKDEPMKNNLPGDTDELLKNLKAKKASKKTKAKKQGKKFFIYTKEKGNPSKTRSGLKLTFKVYEIKDNVPNYIGFTEANSASYKGDSSTVMNYLASEKVIPSTYNGYYKSDMEDKFVIIKV
jgi:hypothetical protein